MGRKTRSLSRFGVEKANVWRFLGSILCSALFQMGVRSSLEVYFRSKTDVPVTQTKTPPDDAFDPSDIGEVMRAFVEALPEKEDLPDGLCEDMAVVSNSSALLGRDLGPEIDSHRVVVRFNEYARVGLDNFERHVGRRTTCHVVSEQVIAEFMEDEKMLEALRKTPMTLWMPPMAWGNSTAYGRYVRLLLSNSEADGLELSERQRRQVVLLRPSVSFSMWKYFRPHGNRSSDFDGDSVDSDDADEARRRPLASMA